ncbi:MAG: ribonuclease III, partial [Dehalococcoidales bacterium]|nr:ribonuclease III [Dehalococcoidales bacterium]MDP6501143.1 ribonuclease III [Dehalococcoidales bacterium]
MADLDSLQQTLDISFRDVSLLEQSLVHSSYINENLSRALTSNERLEFLGDAVLGLVVAEKLYRDYPNFSEGTMTKLRSALVRRETLARVAKTIKLGDHLYLGRGEEAGGGRLKPANLASGLEALIAAVLLDQGPTETRDFILKLLAAEMEKAISQGSGIDHKSELQHLIQSREQKTLVYQVIDTTGPDHSKTFTVEVRLGDTLLGSGSGSSKKTAETKAARAALERISTNFTQ